MHRSLLVHLDGRLVAGDHAPVHGHKGSQRHRERQVDDERYKHHRHHAPVLLLRLLARGEKRQKLRQQQRAARDGGQRGVEQEQQEVLVVEQPNAVDDPDAVVVHLEDAAIGHTAVVSPLGFPGLALAAEAWAQQGVHRQPGYLPRLHRLPLQGRLLVGAEGVPVAGDHTGAGEYCGEVAPAQHEHQRREQRHQEDGAGDRRGGGTLRVAEVGVRDGEVGGADQPQHQQHHHVAQQLEAFAEAEAVQVLDAHRVPSIYISIVGFGFPFGSGRAARWPGASWGKPPLKTQRATAAGCAWRASCRLSLAADRQPCEIGRPRCLFLFYFIFSICSSPPLPGRWKGYAGPPHPPAVHLVPSTAAREEGSRCA
mmetsp:Transcript_26349/g.68153  ORF Transcript_26349/g.68153 Transcript_26349/m.68153 type:complete len:368 (-) Transcript_26349:81-1184(-)